MTYSFVFVWVVHKRGDAATLNDVHGDVFVELVGLLVIIPKVV